MRFTQNPSIAALNWKPADDQTLLYPSSLPGDVIQRLQDELRSTKAHISEQAQKIIANEVEQASQSNNTASSSTTATSVVDPNKLNQRLKEMFREKITAFREAVYLLTGFKVHLSHSLFASLSVLAAYRS